MSKDKLEINYLANNLPDPIENVPQTGNQGEEEPLSIITSSQAMYTEEMLLERIELTGLLDDYIGGHELGLISKYWLESFSNDDLIQIFTTFPSVYDRCSAQLCKSLGSVTASVLLFNDTFCNLFESLLQKAKNVHLKYRWGFGENTPEFNEFEFATSLLHSFLEEDTQACGRNGTGLVKTLDKFAQSDFVKLQDTGLTVICTQLQNIAERGRCSAGFSEQLSRIYTAITLARSVIYYGNLLKIKSQEGSGEPSCKISRWDYSHSAVFFKMKPDIKKEIVSPLYHGTIDTDVAKRLLRNPGDYLARYSSNYKKHYLTVLLDGSNSYSKVVQHLAIPIDKVDLWIQQPMEYRMEIEAYIKQQLSKEQSEMYQPFVSKFFEKEQYSPIFNPICNNDIRNMALRMG